MINIKKQTKRTTKWYERFANNINIVYGKKESDFQFALVTTTGWGNFKETDIEDPLVELTIDGKEYSMPLSAFKAMIKDKSGDDQNKTNSWSYYELA